MPYAWIIDKDHVAGPADSWNAIGERGPDGAPDWMLEVLKGAKPALTDDERAELTRLEAEFAAAGGRGVENADRIDALRAKAKPGIYRFRMYDADGNLYYTGRMITDEGESEEACYGPLGDYGAPAAGAVEIRYHGRKDMDCG